MRAGFQNGLVRYAIAVFAVSGALIAQFLLKPYIGDKTPFIVFYLSVVISALFAGFGPGILATVLSAAAAGYFFIEPVGSFYPSTAAGFISLIIFITAGFSISYLSRLRWRSEAALAEQREQFKTQLDEMNALLDILPTGVWFANSECSVIKGNAAAYKMLDLPQGINASFTGGEMELPAGLKLFVDGLETPPEKMPMQQVARTGKAMLNFEQEIHYHDGSKKIVYTSVVPLFDQKGEVSKVVGVYTDFTERKQIEHRYRSLFTSMQEGLLLAEMVEDGAKVDFRYLDVNPAAEQFLGLSRDQIVGRTAREIIPDVREELLEMYVKVVRTGEPLRHEIFEPLLNQHHENFAFRPAPGQVAVLFWDISERKQTEAEARRLAAINQATSDFVAISEASGTLVYINRSGRGMVGIAPDADIAGYSHKDLCPSWVFERTKNEWMPTALEKGSAAGEGALLTLDGREIPVSFVMLVHRSDSGEVEFLSTIARDITERKQYEQALAETSEALSRERERLAVALRAGNLGVYEWQVGEEAVWWAPETFLLYGVDPATFVPTIENFNELVFPDDRQELWRKTEASLSGGSFFTHEYRIIRPDGQIRWIANRSQIAFGEDGKAARITGVAMDVTERRQAEKILRESEEKFRTLGEAIPNLAWLSDDQGHSLYVNPAWSNYTGLTIEQFNEQGWQSLHPPEELPQLEKAWIQALEHGSMLEVETLARRFDGVHRWFMARSIPLKDADGKIVRWVGTLTDIHELKQAKEALKEANSNKELFLATLAHELRNPLAPVRGGLEIVRRSLDDRATVERMLAIIERQTGQLYRLVDDLLDISRITHGKIKLQKSRFALDEAINLAVETSHDFIEKCGCTLSVSPAEEMIWLDADITRIAQIVSNLLNNAARYNKPQGSIRLTTARLDGMAVIKISDTGIGIPPMMLSNIFEPYNQVNGGAPQSGRGIGIGLSVVKRLVEMHGGSVTATSGGVDRGSEFVVYLPAVEEEIKAETALPNNIERLVEKSDFRRVLIVDDNEDAAAMLEFLLKSENYDVRTAFSGAKALETAAEFNPQIALLDIGLPDLTGYELAERLKKQFPALRLLAISGWGQEEDRRRSKEAGFDYHLVKPVEFEELQKLIHL